MLGKSGKIKIEITYTNHDKHQVKVAGKEETLYTPFVVTSATVISSSNNKNVEVTNGKEVKWTTTTPNLVFRFRKNTRLFNRK